MKRTIYRIVEITKEIKAPDTDCTIDITEPIYDGNAADIGTELFPDLESAKAALIKAHGEEFDIDYYEGGDCLNLDQFCVEEVEQTREDEEEEWEDESWGAVWGQEFPNKFCFGKNSYHHVEAYFIGRYTTRMSDGEYFPVEASRDYTVRSEHFEKFGVDADAPTVSGEDLLWNTVGELNSYADLKNLIEEAE